MLVAADDPVVVAIAAAHRDGGEALAHSCHEAAVAMTGGPVALAFASSGRDALDDALRRADLARRFAAHRQPEAGIVDSRELGGTSLVLDALPQELRAVHADAVLGPLVAHDAGHNGELLRTLRTFLGTGGSWIETARALHVHVNTLRYRAGRIEELTGRSLASTAGRAEMHLALAARDAQPR